MSWREGTQGYSLSRTGILVLANQSLSGHDTATIGAWGTLKLVNTTISTQTGLHIDFAIEADTDLTAKDAAWLQDRIIDLLEEKGWRGGGGVRPLHLDD